MATTRKPNHNACGQDLAGQEVNYNATSGDVIVIGGYNYNVVDTYPNGVHTRRPGMSEDSPVDTFTYRELIKRGAFFAKL
jgi:hypothetical protein